MKGLQQTRLPRSTKKTELDMKTLRYGSTVISVSKSAISFQISMCGLLLAVGHLSLFQHSKILHYSSHFNECLLTRYLHQLLLKITVDK